jgi:hypothetical protein
MLCPYKRVRSVGKGHAAGNNAVIQGAVSAAVRRETGKRDRIWQKGFYEHVIRNDDDLCRIREYITNNSLQWAADKENPDFVPPSK